MAFLSGNGYVDDLQRMKDEFVDHVLNWWFGDKLGKQGV